MRKTKARGLFEEGQALTQALVGAGLLGITVMGFASMMILQQKETKALTEKLGALDFEKLLMVSLADGTVCTKELTATPHILNPADLAATNISLPGIHASAAAGAPLLVTAGAAPSALSTSLKIESISVKNFISTGAPSQYLADFVIAFKTDLLVRPLKPVVLRTNITTDTVNKIIRCSTNGGNNSLPTPPACTDPAKALHWSGSGWSCDSVSTGGGSSIPTPVLCNASTKVLHWNLGSGWACDTLSGTSNAATCGPGNRGVMISGHCCYVGFDEGGTQEAFFFCKK